MTKSTNPPSSLVALVLLAFCLSFTIASAAGPQTVLPVRPSEGAVLLHDQWKFKYLAATEGRVEEWRGGG
jgi:hypothetical protein